MAGYRHSGNQPTVTYKRSFFKCFRSTAQYLPAQAAIKNVAPVSPPSGLTVPAFRPTPFCPRRGAQDQTDKGERLSERSEFELDPGWTEHRRLPAAQRRDADSRVAFSWLTFFWRSKRKVSRPSRRQSGIRTHQRTKAADLKQGFDRLSPILRYLRTNG